MPASRPSIAFAALAVLVACGIGGSAQAETMAQFDVSATITAGCLVDGLGASGNAGRIGGLDFGVDSTFSTATHTATTTSGQTIRLRCTPGANLMMSIDGGSHAAAGTRNLQLGANSGARIAYSLCRDTGCTQPITIGTPYAVPVSGTNSEDVRLPIYGALTLPGTRPPGPYTDTLTVTLTW